MFVLVLIVIVIFSGCGDDCPEYICVCDDVPDGVENDPTGSNSIYTDITETDEEGNFVSIDPEDWVEMRNIPRDLR